MVGMEGFPRRVGWAVVACVLVLGAVAWVVGVIATPVAPWLQPAPGESVFLGLGPTARGDVMVAILVGALVGSASVLAAWARRAVWIPAVVAWVVAPAVADRLAGAEFLVPLPLAAWHEVLFAHFDLGIGALLALSWIAAGLEMALVTAPAWWLFTRRRPRPVTILGWFAVVLAAGALDVLVAEGRVVGPAGLAAGAAGIGAVGWVVALAVVGWAVATAGPSGPVALVGLAGGLNLKARDEVLEPS